jgi:hypothetical protein
MANDRSYSSLSGSFISLNQHSVRVELGDMQCSCKCVQDFEKYAGCSNRVKVTVCCAENKVLRRQKMLRSTRRSFSPKSAAVKKMLPCKCSHHSQSSLLYPSVASLIHRSAVRRPRHRPPRAASSSSPIVPFPSHPTAQRAWNPACLTSVHGWSGGLESFP